VTAISIGDNVRYHILIEGGGMARVRVFLEVWPAPDDSTLTTSEFGREIRALPSRLRSRGVDAEFPSMGHGPGGGIDLLITLGPPAIAATAAILGGFVQARYGRKVRLKFGDAEAEGRTVEEIQNLLQQVKEFHDRHSTKDGQQ
jgi:hypothetical protein